MNDRPPILLGTAQLSTRYGVTNSRMEDPRRRESASLLEAAARSGVDQLDTAPVYGDAEIRIGESPVRFRVHTKLRSGMPVAQSLAESRRRLREQQIDVVYLHDPDEVLRSEGQVLGEARRMLGDTPTSLGASIYDMTQFDAALADPSIAVVQVPLNLLDRRFAGPALRRAGTTGTRVIARSVLLQGVLAVPPDQLPHPVSHLAPHVRHIGEIAAAARISPLEACVGWVRALTGLDGLVLGATDTAELSALVDAAATLLDPAVVEALDALRLPESSACDPRAWSVR